MKRFNKKNLYSIYVWIYKNRVNFIAKLFRLPAGDSRQGGLRGASKPKGCRQGGWKQRALVSSYQLIPSRGPRNYPQGGGGSHRKRHFPELKCWCWLPYSSGQTVAWKLRHQTPASQTEASSLSAGTLPVGHWVKSLCIILEKSQAVVVVISTVFKNPDIYICQIITSWPKNITILITKNFSSVLIREYWF